METESRKKISITSIFRIAMYLVGIVASLLLFILTSITQYRGMINDAQQNLANNARFIASNISTTLKFYKDLAIISSDMPAFSAENTSNEIKQKVLQNIAGTYDFNSFDIIDNNGYALNAGKYVGNQEYFRQTQNGNVFISAPAENRRPGEDINGVILCVPIWKKQAAAETAGALYFELSSKIVYGAAAFAKLNPQVHFAVFDRYFTPLIVENSFSASIQELTDAIKRNPRPVFSAKTSQDKSSIIVAHHTIQTTDDWEIVVYLPASEILKGFHKVNESKIFSLLVLIIITELTIFLVNKKVCTPIARASTQLKKAANGNLTSLSAEETFVAEADQIVRSASNLIDKLNISIALEDEFGSNATLSDLVAPSVLKHVLNFYNMPQYKGLNLILCESNGSFLMESSPIDGIIAPLSSDLPPIKSVKVEARIIGTVEFQLAEDSIISESAARQIIISLGEQLSILAESNYRHSLYHKSQVAKLQRSLGSLAKANTQILSQLNPLISVFEETSSEEFLSLSPLKLEKEKIGIVSSLRQITNQVDKAIESSVRSELISSLTEEPYTTEELVNSIEKIELPKIAHTKCSVNVHTSPSLPKTLFGDAKYITRLVMWNEEMLLQSGENNQINISLDAAKGTYNCNLLITIQNKANCFSAQYMQRIKAYQNGDFMAFGETETMSNKSWRLISIIRIVKMQNGTINISQNEQSGAKIEISLPQVEVNRE